MKESTKEEFYREIGPCDVELRVVGQFPFTTEFRIKENRRLIGKIVESYHDGTHYPITTKYFLADESNSNA